MPDMTIIIPHRPGQHNDDALSLNVEMLLDNTYHSFELIVDTEVPKDPYKVWNEAAKVARSDVLIFSNTDVLMAPEWDVSMLAYCRPNRITVGYLVEAGNVGVAEVNIQRNFGKVPEQFDRATFEKFAGSFSRKFPDILFERAWYMPCAMDREWFLSTGGFDTTLGFPNPNDILFWNRCRDELGTEFVRVNSFAYHFQALSTRD